MTKILSKSKLQSMKVVQLREQCKTNELESKGLKSVLINRLLEHFKTLQEAETEAADGGGETAEAEAEEANEEEMEYHMGTVKSWMKTGYGFIETEAVDDDGKPVEIFVHKSDVKMAEGEDAALRKGMSVMFREKEGDGKKKGDKNKGKTHAVDVKGQDGEPLSWWKQNGDSDRMIFDEPTLGIIGDFRYHDQSGYILALDEITTPTGETVTIYEKLHVKRRDFITEGDRPSLHPGREVQFKLFKDERGFGATYVQSDAGEALGKLEDPKKGEEDIDAEKRYTGRVLVFKMNNHGFISPDEDLSKHGVVHKLYFKTEDIECGEAKHAMVAVGMPVSFTIAKDDKKGLSAKGVSMPDGTAIELPEGHEYKPYSEIQPRESLEELKFEGKVSSFFWDKGFGYIKMDTGSNDVEIPEEIKEKIKDDSIYFHWDDLNSEDKVIGVNKDFAVVFNLYKDEKGIGAENITKPDGEAISGQERAKGQTQGRRRNNNRSKGRRGRGRGRGRRGRGGRGRGRRGWKRKGNFGYGPQRWKRFNSGPSGSMFGVSRF